MHAAADALDGESTVAVTVDGVLDGTLVRGQLGVLSQGLTNGQGLAFRSGTVGGRVRRVGVFGAIIGAHWPAASATFPVLLAFVKHRPNPDSE